MRSVYLDTEFTQLEMNRRLISLALVDSQGSEFYVELLDTWREEDCSEFVKTVVLPQLDLNRFGLSEDEARTALRRYLGSLGEVEIVGDALDWDWPLLLELAGPAGLPRNIKRCRDAAELMNDVDPATIPHHALLDARLLCRAGEDGANDG